MRGSRRADATMMRWTSSGTVDLGNDPPLSVGDKADDRPVRRAVSLRWMSGTILTGFTSIFLMGGALMAALDTRHGLMIPSEVNALLGIGSEALISNGKSDRFRPVETRISAREIIKVGTVSKQGDRDLIKLRPFARISASLSARPDQFSGKVPPFDPLKIFAEGTIDAAAAEKAPTDQLYGADVDGEVTVKIGELPLDDSAFDPIADFKVAEVEQIVHDAVRPEAGEYADQEGTSYADARVTVVGPNPGGGTNGVLITAQNVTQIGKSDGGGLAKARSDRVVSLPAKTSLKDLLRRNNVATGEADEIVAALTPLIDLGKLKVGERIRIGFAPFEEDGGAMRPVRVSIYDGGAHQATVARADSNRFVRADAPEPLAGIETGQIEDDGPMPSLYEAVYRTALSQQLPESLTNDLIKIFSYEVDYQTQVTPGDAIEIFHSLPDPEGEGDEASEEGILYASITLGGVKKRFYRFRTSDDGTVDYYDADGRSAKKFLMRRPMTVGRYVSGFGYRRHPILGYVRLHGGVDWAAPRGAPIMAAGNGIIEKAERTSGYGNFVLIKHTNGYETGYGHMSAFAKGAVPGTRVRQGQIIGYVGSTGLSTGNHLHYEVRVNRKFVDPLRIRLPRGRVLQGDMLAAFERERDRIDDFLGHPTAGTKVAAR